MASVLSTAMSRLNAFLDSEMEQVLCFDSSLDTETFCSTKSAIFIVLPEEDNTKYFMVSLFLQKLYREMLTIADEHGGKLPNRVMLFADEIGTIPQIEIHEMMLFAGRSAASVWCRSSSPLLSLRKTMGRKAQALLLITVRISCSVALRLIRKARRSYQRRSATARCCPVPYPEERVIPARACR